MQKSQKKKQILKIHDFGHYDFFLIYKTFIQNKFDEKKSVKFFLKKCKSTAYIQLEKNYIHDSSIAGKTLK